MKFFLKKWLPVILWMTLIFFLSAQPGLKSNLPFIWDFILRKFVHIFEYFILYLLFFYALYSPCCVKSNNKNIKALYLSALFSFIYAISDEYHQRFVFQRCGCKTDVFIDSIGILIGYWIIKRKMIK